MILGKYNQAKTITFDLVAPDGVDLIVAATFAAGDVVIMKDEGVEASTTNLPTDEGTGYSLVLTATEMSAARIRVYVIDQTATKIWLDISLGLETYGNASAEHAFDLDTAAETMRGTDSAALATALATVDTNVDSILVDTAEIGVAGAGLTALATQTSVNTIDTNVDSILVDTGTTLETHLTDMKGGTFAGATDSLEAIRDRGDSAWTTGAGGTPPQLLQSTTIATLASQVSFTLTAGSADNDVYNGAIAIITDSVTSTQKAVGEISDYVGSTKTVTLSTDPAIFTMAVGDTIDIIASVSNAPTAIAIRQEIDSNSTQLAAIIVDTGTDIPATITTVQNDLDIVTGTDGATLATAQALYAPAKAGDAMALTAAATSAQLVDDVWDEALSGHNTGGTTGKAVKQLQEGTVSAESTVNDASATTTSFITALTEATDNHYKDVSLVFIDGTLWGQSRPVVGYNGTTKVITLEEAFTEAPVNGDGFIIKTDHVHPVSDIQAGLATEAKQDVIDTNVDAVLVDTAELQTDWANGGRLDLILDSVKVDTASGGIPKNAIFNDFEFPMVLTSDHYTAATAKTVTGQRSIDGSAFANATGTVAEVGSGVYQIDLTAADTNGDTITYKFSATDCDDTIITVTTRS